jgi:hypothetical protein
MVKHSCLIHFLLARTIGEVIKSDVMTTFFNFHVSKINPGFLNTLKSVFVDVRHP